MTPPQPVRSRFYRSVGKRAFDASVAVAGLVATSPLLGAIALVSAATQGRPVFFRQSRIGRYGRPFTLWKFRTMRVRPHADSTVTTRNDARVTPLGAWLRRTKLDELPQLWCVARGDMSFVGPRPDVAGYWDEVPEEDRELLDLRPGITGPGSLLFRDEEVLLAEADDPQAFNDQVLFPEKVRLTRRYADRVTLGDDLRWIVFTLLPGRVAERWLAAAGWQARIAQSDSATSRLSE